MNFKYERKKIKQGYTYIIGCDEVGRGCLAGPVVAAAVILQQAESYKVPKVYKEIRDSKLLSAGKRQELDPIIKQNAVAWSIAEVSSEVVDEVNIHNASLLAMKKAVEKLVSHLCHCEPKAKQSKNLDEIAALPSVARNDIFLSVDGKFVIPRLDIDQEAIIDGDNKILSIAAASIIAKVYRDNLMAKLHQTYPTYNFAQHKGYATLYHRQMIRQNGLSPSHRLSFCSNLV